MGALRTKHVLLSFSFCKLTESSDHTRLLNSLHFQFEVRPKLAQKAKIGGQHVLDYYFFYRYCIFSYSSGVARRVKFMFGLTAA